MGRALTYTLIYIVVGLVFAQFAAHSTFAGVRFWRLAAWIVSAIVFGTHIQYERVTAGRSRFDTGFHAAIAAALGAFGLALAAILHRHAVGLPGSGLLGLALILWPVMTFFPAFLVGIAAATIMRPPAVAP